MSPIFQNLVCLRKKGQKSWWGPQNVPTGPPISLSFQFHLSTALKSCRILTHADNKI